MNKDLTVGAGNGLVEVLYAPVWQYHFQQLYNTADSFVAGKSYRRECRQLVRAMVL